MTNAGNGFHYVFTNDSTLIRFEKYTDYDFLSGRFLRLSENFPRRLGTQGAFEDARGEFYIATQTNNGMILLIFHNDDGSLSYRLYPNENSRSVNFLDVTSEANDFIFFKRSKDCESGKDFEYILDLYIFKAENRIYGFAQKIIFSSRLHRPHEKFNENEVFDVNFRESWKPARGKNCSQLHRRNYLGEGLMPYYRWKNGSYLAIYTRGWFYYLGENMVHLNNNRFDFHFVSDYSDNYRIMFGCPSNLCIDAKIDAMLRKKNSNDAYIIYGAFIFLHSVQQRVPRDWKLLSEELSVSYSYMDAAFYEPQSDSYYFFKERRVYRDDTDIGVSIRSLFHRSGFDHNTRIDAAVCYNGYVRNVINCIHWLTYKLEHSIEQAVYKYKVMGNNTFAKEDQMKITSFMKTILPHVSAATVLVFDNRDLIYVRHETTGPESYHNRFQYQALDCSLVRGAVIENQSMLIEEQVSKITFTSTTPLNVEITTTSEISQTTASIFASDESQTTTNFEILLPPPLTQPPEIANATRIVAINPGEDFYPTIKEIVTEEEGIVPLLCSTPKT
ncbi:hypothetical protein B4U79_18360 [Dinothrombium tinctorium]|uniref:Uncharacterized protein n=1 Tax=Dinothrombium tinctorium TaxID=1965070 RepID=A0A3S3Q4Z0_9ACAR|nr:hypothetical protein B4U79_18428 [Dinothrombium tinctorium]RWS03497.1 hypothetical protein B4U79_18425 [Dinothrombium tinctorium]RWS04538.1 hypothetical protein B4U79_18360 [Dinothrombium tinctorium]